ncbi:hypothetical protein N7537_001843 [Penicillium hordei]|uniref:Uncharacterized protein n=1 Tax=Penicillium hordei TaxID=40994 RepID=A0AAD6EG75_9EURO|nr:uncharacterized protein N7537_001843 [Penicillium hordei]KAJ5616729.1 hypothetical protein N7537_001843 [Penicillium hordei]
MSTKKKVVVNSYFLSQEDHKKYAPPYFQDGVEILEETECTTQGDWPSWLSGTLVRVAAGRYTVPLSEDDSKPAAILQHFFDGLAMLHRFRMHEGKVYYNNRHTANGVVAKAKKTGYLSSHFFGPNANTSLIEAEDPCSALFRTQQSFFTEGGHSGPEDRNIAVVPRRGYSLPPSSNSLDRGVASNKPEQEELIVHTDFNALQVCDQKTLEPKRLLTYAEIDPELAGHGICAHPPKDRTIGCIYNYLVNKTGKLSVFSLQYTESPAKLKWKTEIPCKPCYIHSMAMTQNYVVFIRNPISLDTSDVSKSITDMMIYEEESPVSFFVLDKFTGKFLAQYDGPNFMFFHTVNGFDFYESGDRTLQIDICAYDTASIPYREYCVSNVVDPAEPFADGTLVRYQLERLDYHTESKSVGRVVVAQSIPGTGMELPRIAKSASMNPNYRYVYATGGNGESSPGTLVPIGRLGNGLKVIQAAFFGSIVKSDWETGSFLKWKPSGGESCPCEPIMVSRPGSTEEDDGVVLTIVCNKTGTHSILIALDAKTLTEVGRAIMSTVYPLGPHGTFIEM